MAFSASLAWRVGVLIQPAGEALRFLQTRERRRESLRGIALSVLLISIARPRQRNLGVLELTLRLAEVHVVEADASIEDAAPRFGEIQLLLGVVERALGRPTARRPHRKPTSRMPSPMATPTRIFFRTVMASFYEQNLQVAHIRFRGSRHDEISDRLKERIRIVFSQRHLSIQAPVARTTHRR